MVRARLQLAESDACEEGTEVGERSVLEEAYQFSGTVAVDGADDVVGVQVEIERVGDEADGPEGDEENDEVDGLFGPGQADEPGEGRIENTLTGEGPGDGVPEGGEGRAPTLEDERGEDDSLPELGVRASHPFVLHHADGDEEDEEINGIEAGDAGEPELTFTEGPGALRVVVGEDVTGDEKEDADEDIAVVDERIEKAKMGRREMKQDDSEGEQGADSCERRQRSLASVRCMRNRRGRLSELGFRLGFGL